MQMLLRWRWHWRCWQPAAWVLAPQLVTKRLGRHAPCPHTQPRSPEIAQLPCPATARVLPQAAADPLQLPPLGRRRRSQPNLNLIWT